MGVLFDEVISRQFSDPHHDKGAYYHDPWYRNQVPTRSEFFRPDAFGGRMLGCDSVGGVGWPKRCDMFQFWCIMIFEFLKVQASLVNFRGRAGGPTPLPSIFGCVKTSVFLSNTQSRFMPVVLGGVLRLTLAKLATPDSVLILVIQKATYEGLSAQKAIQGSETKMREFLEGTEEKIIPQTRCH